MIITVPTFSGQYPDGVKEIEVTPIVAEGKISWIDDNRISMPSNVEAITFGINLGDNTEIVISCDGTQYSDLSDVLVVGQPTNVVYYKTHQGYLRRNGEDVTVTGGLISASRLDV